MDELNVPVLVVGGGPVGLAAACFLTRHGVAPMLVEKRDDTSVLPRAPGIQARTLEIFRSMGLEKEIRALELDNSHPYFEGGILRTRTLAEISEAEVIEAPSLDGPGISPVRVMGCGQDRYERVLVEAAQAGGADIRFGHRLLDFTQDEDGVTAEVQQNATGRRLRVRAQYMVAADGARSMCRQHLGTAMSGRGTIFHAMSIYFRAPGLEELMGDRKFILCYAGAGDNLLAVSRLHGCDPWAGAAMYDPARGESPADFTSERCVELIRAVSGRPDLPVEIAGTVPWEGAQRVADAFNTGRVFLAGDAAHVHPPAGGFGANTGIHDAHNLSWKLAAVLHGRAAPALLSSYDAERRPLGMAMAEQALLRNRLRHNHASAEDAAGMVDDIVVTLGYRYRSGAIVSGDFAGVLPPVLQLGGEPGSRAPHLWLRKDDRRISTIDLFDTAFVLLTGPDGGAWRQAATALAARTGMLLRCHSFGEGGDLAAEQDWASAYGVGPGGAVLVRPDAFVAWRSTEAAEDPQTVLGEVFDAVSGRVPVGTAAH